MKFGIDRKYGEMMHQYKIILIAMVVAGCANTDVSAQPSLETINAGEVPSYITEYPSCALVVGGTGSSFADQNIGKIWHIANRQIAGYLYEILSNEGYQVRRFVVPQDTSSDSALSAVAIALAQSKCNTFIQVAHDVDEDGKGPYFQYSVSVIHVEANKDKQRSASGTNVTTVSDYNRDYRYARTAYNLETFRTGTFANQAFDDLKANGALTRITRGD